jgi:hypothetical protein
VSKQERFVVLLLQKTSRHYTVVWESKVRYGGYIASESRGRSRRRSNGALGVICRVTTVFNGQW